MFQLKKNFFHLRRFRDAETVEIPSIGEKEAKRNSTPFWNSRNEYFSMATGQRLQSIYDVFAKNMISMATRSCLTPEKTPLVNEGNSDEKKL